MKTFIGILSLTLATGLWADALKVTSPDGKYFAEISQLTNNEAVVVVKNTNDYPLAIANFQSEDSEHGYSVVKYAWSADSQFFVFSMASSGGHSPWKSPTYFYSRKSEAVRSVDYRLGANVTDSNFAIDNRDQLTVTALPNGQALGSEKQTIVSLSFLDDVRDGQ